MPFPGKAPAQAVDYILIGTLATRAAVAAQFRTAPIGTIYISAVANGGTGRMYIKVTESGGASGTAADWKKFTLETND